MEPKGVYKEIDIARDNEAIGILGGTDTILKRQIVDSILKNPNNYNPPVIYSISHELYAQGKKNDAMYWFYIAQLRARIDANLCTDISARQAVSVLNNIYGPEINKYAFQDVGNLESTVKRVVEFVRVNDENYDHRWINLHGMDAVTSSLDGNTENKELSLPRDKWAEVKQKTIDDYYNGFIEYVVKKK